MCGLIGFNQSIKLEVYYVLSLVERKEVKSVYLLCSQTCSLWFYKCSNKSNIRVDY